MQIEELTIGAPFSFQINNDDGTVFDNQPYVVLLNRTSNTYYSASVTAVADSIDSNNKYAKYDVLFDATTTNKLIPGKYTLEIWDTSVSSNFVDLLKRIEEYARASYGAASSKMTHGNPPAQS